MKFTSLACAGLTAMAAVVATPAVAQSAPDAWKFQAILYGFFPSVGGSTTFPERSGTGSSINVSNSTLLSNLDFTFMGTFEARKGRWGIFTDFIYLDVSGGESATRDFTVGGHGVPASVSGNLDLDLKGIVWTLAGEYALIQDPANEMYVLGGARLLDIKSTLSYSLTGDVGPIVGPGRNGSSEVDASFWDAIVGVKGRVSFGDRRQWFVPYYADIGTGESELTYQLFGGLGYNFSWGSVLAGWRYLDYRFKSGSNFDNVDFNGPMVGVGFRW